MCRHSTTVYPARHFWLTLVPLPCSPIVAELPEFTPPAAPHPGADLPPLTLRSSRAPRSYPWPLPGHPILLRSPIVAELPNITPPAAPHPGADLPLLTLHASRAPRFYPWLPPGHPILSYALPAPATLPPAPVWPDFTPSRATDVPGCTIPWFHRRGRPALMFSPPGAATGAAGT